MTTVEWWPLGHLPPLGSGAVSPNSAVHQLTIQFCSSFYSEVGKHFPGVYCTLCFQATPRVAQPLQSLGFLPTSPNLSLNQHSVSAAVSPQRLLPTCLNLLVSRVTGSCRAHCRGQGRASGEMACTLHIHLTCLPTIFWLPPSSPDSHFQVLERSQLHHPSLAGCLDLVDTLSPAGMLAQLFPIQPIS